MKINKNYYNNNKKTIKQINNLINKIKIKNIILYSKDKKELYMINKIM